MRRARFYYAPVGPLRPQESLDALLAEQLAYYRARAPEYSETAIPDLPTGELAVARDRILAELEGFRPEGDVLELACGPATWTQTLLRHADRVTAVDGAPEVLELAASKVNDSRVRFVQADIFEWQPDRRYDAVFFGFWLSHVPTERFANFWHLVGECLKPNGRVAFVDDAYRTPDELIDGEQSEVIRRTLNNGTTFKAVKVPHTPARLEQRLRGIGWDVSVQYLVEPFFWGSGAQER
jgi:demethylmenaquinone methyltransferase/2-methoxy-6-polyprenyl-1,4-benzoquinol methylase